MLFIFLMLNLEIEKFLVLNFEAVESVTWSNDGKYLAFIGQNARQSDIYTYNFETKEIKNLTNDIFSDFDPSWSHDDKVIYFSSDRGDKLDAKMLPPDFRIMQHDYTQKDIYKYVLESESIVRINRSSI